MKLYTEEQIKRTFGFVLSDMDLIEYINTMKPIELPSDEEIIKQAIIHTEAHTLKFVPRNSFIQGIKWVIDKIKNNDRQKVDSHKHDEFI